MKMSQLANHSNFGRILSECVLFAHPGKQHIHGQWVFALDTILDVNRSCLHRCTNLRCTYRFLFLSTYPGRLPDEGNRLDRRTGQAPVVERSDLAPLPQHSEEIQTASDGLRSHG